MKLSNKILKFSTFSLCQHFYLYSRIVSKSFYFSSCSFLIITFFIGLLKENKCVQGYIYSSTVDYLSKQQTDQLYIWILLVVGWVLPNTAMLFFHFLVITSFRWDLRFWSSHHSSLKKSSKSFQLLKFRLYLRERNPQNRKNEVVNLEKKIQKNQNFLLFLWHPLLGTAPPLYWVPWNTGREQDLLNIIKNNEFWWVNKK